MTFPGQLSNDLPDYGFARSLGLASGSDIDFTALANQLDCSRSFSQVGIIYSDVGSHFTCRGCCGFKKRGINLSAPESFNI